MTGTLPPPSGLANPPRSRCCIGGAAWSRLLALRDTPPASSRDLHSRGFPPWRVGGELAIATPSVPTKNTAAGLRASATALGVPWCLGLRGGAVARLPLVRRRCSSMATARNCFVASALSTVIRPNALPPPLLLPFALAPPRPWPRTTCLVSPPPRVRVGAPPSRGDRRAAASFGTGALRDRARNDAVALSPIAMPWTGRRRDAIPGACSTRVVPPSPREALGWDVWRRAGSLCACGRGRWPLPCRRRSLRRWGTPTSWLAVMPGTRTLDAAAGPMASASAASSGASRGAVPAVGALGKGTCVPACMYAAYWRAAAVAAAAGAGNEPDDASLPTRPRDGACVERPGTDTAEKGDKYRLKWRASMSKGDPADAGAPRLDVLCKSPTDPSLPLPSSPPMPSIPRATCTSSWPGSNCCPWWPLPAAGVRARSASTCALARRYRA